ncbi:hypothetical protein SAMD00019534_110030, partial [Acytostelium subglobosum LB1]|uniref:hypothetical protein n=1 Tax=Acytostelium subglobosum LB1 TaxID=1410327 RepID=UPI000644F269
LLIIIFIIKFASWTVSTRYPFITQSFIHFLLLLLDRGSLLTAAVVVVVVVVVVVASSDGLSSTLILINDGAGIVDLAGFFDDDDLSESSCARISSFSVFSVSFSLLNCLTNSSK